MRGSQGLLYPYQGCRRPARGPARGPASPADPGFQKRGGGGGGEGVVNFNS